MTESGRVSRQMPYAATLVLLAIVVLVRPSGDALPAQSAPAPTSASVGQASTAAQSAAQVPTIAAPTVAPRPNPRPSGPAAPGFDGGGEWGGPAVDPESGILYVNANQVPWVLKMFDVGNR